MSFTSYTVNAMRCFYHGRVYCTQIVLNMFNKIEDYEMVTKKLLYTHTQQSCIFSVKSFQCMRILTIPLHEMFGFY